VSNPTRTGQSGQAAQVQSGQIGQSAKTTLVEDDTEFKGTLSSKCPVLVKGTVEGEVIGPSLHVSPTGSVSGKVKVAEFRSEGIIAGEVDADAVHLAGTVKNDTVIRARSLEVRLTPPGGKMQITFGQCELAVGEVPTKEEAVAAASARPVAGAKTAPSAAAPAAEATQVRETERMERLERAGGEAEATTAGRPRSGRSSSSSTPAA
jgi:cytoskeletal protein CcmA (bactofilin family)